MGIYQEHALEGASAVDLVVALYDGIIRFLYAACESIEQEDETGRRAAVKRALNIIIHLQARLRMDIGGRPALVLSEFYASVFAQILQASQSASQQKFHKAIDCVRNVRDAWRQVAKEQRNGAMYSRSESESNNQNNDATIVAASGWSA
jgi:flagellar secretion chaperone FliS